MKYERSVHKFKGDITNCTICNFEYVMRKFYIFCIKISFYKNPKNKCINSYIGLDVLDVANNTYCMMTNRIYNIMIMQFGDWIWIL